LCETPRHDEGPQVHSVLLVNGHGVAGARRIGEAPQVIDLVLDLTKISDDERAEKLKSGGLRVDNQVQWARQYLVWADLLDGSQRGRWSLTNDGWALDLDKQDHNSWLS
jgi:restriction endonuclease Mrr